MPLPAGTWSDDRSLIAVVGAVDSAGWSRWSPGNTHDTVLRTLRTRTPRLENDIIAEIERVGPGRAPPRHLYRPPAAIDPGLEVLLQDHEQVLRRHDVRLLDLAAALGLAHLDSCPDRIQFLVATGVLCRVTRPAGVYLVPAWPTPLPQERLRLTPSERTVEDTLRWNDLFEDTTDKIVGLFRPDADNCLAALDTTLEQLGRLFSINAETARHALLVLIGDGDFSATADLSRVEPGTWFRLVVDWDTF